MTYSIILALFLPTYSVFLRVFLPTYSVLREQHTHSTNDNGGLYAENLTDLMHFVYNRKFITENSVGDEDDCYGEYGRYDAVADMRLME